MMTHLRKTNHKARSEVEEPSGHVIDIPTGTPTPAKHRPFCKCTACNLVLFGLAMSLCGTLFGMYFKSTIELAFSRHLEDISDLHRQASEAAATLSLPFRSAVYDPERAIAQGLAEGKRIKASWGQKAVNKLVCDESCPLSKDGKCDDGRSGAGEVLCDLGTDCADCGPWTFQIPPGEKKVSKPIELLREHKVTVNIAQTATQPSFLMPYTNPEQDIDVSQQMAHQQVVELGLTQAWYKALSGQCELPNGERALVLDVGGNFGWYTFYAASNGCRVVVWEPVPIFRAFLEFGLQVNNMTASVRVRARVVAEQPGLQYNLTVPSQGIWGTASIDGRNIDSNTVGDKSEIVAAVSERVDSLIQEDALVVKIDVEGFEPSAFKSMKGVFDNHEVSSFFMEYSPGVYEHSRMWEQLSDMPNMLVSLLKQGFTILHVNDSLARGVSLLGSEDWSGDLPPLEQVTLDNLHNDLDDCRKLQKGTLGCFAPEELARLNEAWQSCNAIPEDLHPKSFRATFGHNTNIWAFKNRTDLKVGPPVGIQSLSQQEQEWYGRNKNIGMGGRTCAAIQPDTMILRHRCPCKKLSCLEEAYVLEKLAKKGLMRKITNRSNGR